MTELRIVQNNEGEPAVSAANNQTRRSFLASSIAVGALSALRLASPVKPRHLELQSLYHSCLALTRPFVPFM